VTTILMAVAAPSRPTTFHAVRRDRTDHTDGDDE
jgi:hypothetical protein